MLTRITTAVTIVSALAVNGIVLAQDKSPVSPSPVKRTVSAIDPWLPDKTQVRSERFNLFN